MIRVLIAEDSPTVQSLLVSIFQRDVEIEVVGSAKDGVEAIEMAATLKPDLITMDLKMPRKTGLEAIQEILQDHPIPIVVVSGSWMTDNVDLEMKALSAGALALVRKPEGPGSRGFDSIADEMLDTVKTMADVKVVRRKQLAPLTAPQPQSASPGGPPPPRKLTPTPPAIQNAPGLWHVQMIAVAASTGGPPALRQLLAPLPETFPVPILLVQHICEGFGQGFAAWLDSVIPLKVDVPELGESARPGHVYVAPDTHHLKISSQGEFVLEASAPVSGFRPSATTLFDSVAQSYGPHALGLILTGMGSDGLPGLRKLKEAGGMIFAQEEQSCVVFGMPGVAVAAGIVDGCYSPDQMASVLLRRMSRTSVET